METAAIHYRVADFLKKYPPFHVINEPDLVQFAGRGRVKFFEPHQYLVTQGASRLQVHVIQQGTVLLWDERGGEAKLLDVRGAGDMIGIDQLNGVRGYPYAARSVSDVLVYSFPADEFDTLVQQYPQAQQHVSAFGNIDISDRLPTESHDPQNTQLEQLLTGREDLCTCDAQTSILEAARYMLATGSEALAVLDSERCVRAVLTARSFLEWMARNEADVRQPVATLLDGVPLTLAPDSLIADAVLTMAAADAEALAVTSGGTTNGRVRAVLTSRDLGRPYGDRPLDILREIQHAQSIEVLRDLNKRARTLVQRYLTNPASTMWLTRFISSVDKKIVERILVIAVLDKSPACWSFCGSAGRRESLTMVAPHVIMMAADTESESRIQTEYERVFELLQECGYLQGDAPQDRLFNIGTLSEWKTRYSDWLSDPILKQIYQGRPYFDMYPISGKLDMWKDIGATITAAINREFLHIVANDCLATLPPLTFFENAVVDETGEETTVFRLEDSTLRPLVDVGRVFGMAARKVFGTSTIQRFEMARELLPDHAPIFTEASESLRIVLWQQGRAGLGHGTSGSELTPSQLNRYDRQLLRSAFRSILRLLEFTGDLKWLKNL